MHLVLRSWRLLTFVSVLIGLVAPARATDDGRTVRGFHHTAWRIENGAPPDVRALAQTTDGFLWIGTRAGLYRFDGVRFERFSTLPGDPQLPIGIYSLFATSKGDLWIASYDGAIFRMRDGHLTRLMSCGRNGLPGDFISDRRGDIWIAFISWPGNGGLARIRDQSCEPIGRAWSLPDARHSYLGVSRRGVIWAMLDNRVFYLVPGAKSFRESNERGQMPNRFLFTKSGDMIWASGSDVQLRSERQAIKNSSTSDRRSFALMSRDGFGPSMLDSDGIFWGRMARGGLERNIVDGHVFGKSPERMHQKDGLTSDLVQALYQDREGNRWIGTDLGLDQFNVSSVVPFPVSDSSAFKTFGSHDGHGNAIIADESGIYKIDASLTKTILSVGNQQVLGVCANFLGDGQSWLATRKGFLRVQSQSLISVSGPPGWNTFTGLGCSVLRDNTLIASTTEGRLYRFDGRWKQMKAPSTSGRTFRWASAAENGGLWLFYEPYRLGRLRDDRIEWFDRDGLEQVGEINAVLEIGGDLLVAGSAGLGRLRGRRFAMLQPAQVPGMLQTTGMALAPNHVLWTSGINGVRSFHMRELGRAFDDPSYRPSSLHLTASDGLPAPAKQNFGFNTAFEAGGRIWFVTSQGMAMLDPTRLTFNSFPPSVLIRSITAGGKVITALNDPTLQLGARDIELDYTATSLVAPGRVMFRYRLDGVDKAWIEAGTRRQAFYTKLPPGDYVFRVIAANDSGVWNREGATVRFTVLPFWYETGLFQAFAAILTAITVWLLYMARIRQATGRMRGLVEERVAERERIARELHDTLLQGFQGLMLRFRAVAAGAPLNGSVHALLDEALDRAERVLVEGRDSVCELRLSGPSSTVEAAIAEAANRFGEGSGAKFAMVVEGTSRPLHPLVAAECRRIGEEALANAFRHAEAETIEARITYGPRALRLRIRDDGRGVTSEDAAAASDRHFGLTGMRERAESVKGELSLRSGVGTGTTIELVVSARVAYARAQSRARFMGVLEESLA